MAELVAATGSSRIAIVESALIRLIVSCLCCKFPAGSVANGINGVEVEIEVSVNAGPGEGNGGAGDEGRTCCEIRVPCCTDDGGSELHDEVVKVELFDEAWMTLAPVCFILQSCDGQVCCNGDECDGPARCSGEPCDGLTTCIGEASDILACCICI